MLFLRISATVQGTMYIQLLLKKVLLGHAGTPRALRSKRITTRSKCDSSELKGTRVPDHDSSVTLWAKTACLYKYLRRVNFMLALNAPSLVHSGIYGFLTPVDCVLPDMLEDVEKHGGGTDPVHRLVQATLEYIVCFL